MQLKMLLGRFVELAPSVVVVPTNPGALVVDSAAPIRFQVAAATVDQQKPAIAVLVDFDVLVGHLPEQQIEIGL